MKKILTIAVAAMLAAGCGASKQATQTALAAPTPQAPQTYTEPCWQPDDADFYRATVSRRAAANSSNTLATACLRAARQNLQQKIKGQLKQVTRDYFDQMDVDAQSTVASHIESASDYIVDQFLGDMLETCRQVTLPDAQGMVTMFIGVEISKKDLVDNLAKGLSENEQTKLRFNEKTFRDEAMKDFAKDRQDSFNEFQQQQ